MQYNMRFISVLMLTPHAMPWYNYELWSADLSVS